MNKPEYAVSRRVDRLSGSLIRELLALTENSDIISFSGGLPAACLMPDISLASLPASISQYGTTDGEKEFRQTVADYVSRSGLAAQEDQVLITSGSQQGIDLIAKLFIDEGTTVYVENPTYLAALQVFGLFGANIVGIDIAADGIDLVSLKDHLEKTRPAFIYINPTYQNPTGYCYSEECRHELAELLDNTGIPLIEDNPYGELCYDGPPPKPICSLLRRTPWVYLGSFSKVAIPAWRIGYMVSHPEFATYFAKLKQGTDLHTNRPGQWWCNAFLKDSSGFKEHISSLRSWYREQRNAMEASLHEHFSDIAKWHMPKGGLFYWLELESHIDTGPMLSEALEKSVAFLPGFAFFAPGDVRGNYIRLSFSEVSQSDIREGLLRLSEVIRKNTAA